MDDPIRHFLVNLANDRDEMLGRAVFALVP
jgi:hypothetical protein